MVACFSEFMTAFGGAIAGEDMPVMLEGDGRVSEKFQKSWDTMSARHARHKVTAVEAKVIKKMLVERFWGQFLCYSASFACRSTAFVLTIIECSVTLPELYLITLPEKNNEQQTNHAGNTQQKTRYHELLGAKDISELQQRAD